MLALYHRCQPSPWTGQSRFCASNLMLKMIKMAAYNDEKGRFITMIVLYQQKFQSSQASVGKIFYAESRSRYDNGKVLFFVLLKKRASGRGTIAPIIDVISDKRVH